MQRLAILSLKNRALIALITIFAAVFGVISMGSLKQELIPALEFPQISVMATQMGASPEVVDEQVAAPLETALQAVEGLESSTATSQTGFTRIALTFEYGTDMDRARAQVERAISNVKTQLPEDVEPTALAGSIADLPVLMLAVSSNESLEALNDDVERIALPKLQKIDGVREAAVSGGASQHIAVIPDDDKLSAAGLSVADLKDGIENAGSPMPVGNMDVDGLQLPVIAGSSPDTLAAIEEIPLVTDNGPVLLKDLAEVSVQADEATSVTRTNGDETLSIQVTKTPDGDTVAISHAVTAMIADLEAELGHKATMTTIFDQAPFIEDSISHLALEGALGLGFAVLIILIFLFSVRSTLVTAISIPLSLMATFIGMNVFGYTLNMLTLGALTISIGRVVDDSIVVIENIKRHLAHGESKAQSILLAVREVAGAITAATLTTVAVFLPIAMVGGMAGELFSPFAMTMAIALLASLLVSLTIVPVLAYWFLPHRPGTGATRTVHVAEDKSWLQRAYVPVLNGTQKHPVITLLASVLILAGTVAMTPLLNTNLLGSTGENSISITAKLPSGTALETTLAEAEKVEAKLQDIEGLEDVQMTVGTASGMAAMFASGADTASFTAITDPDRDQEALSNTVREQIQGLELSEDVTLSFGSNSSAMMSSDVTVEVKAPNEDILREATEKLREALAGTEHVTGIADNLSAEREQVSIDIDADKAAEAGLTEAQLSGLVASQVSAVPAGTLRLDYTDMTVQIGEPMDLNGLNKLRELQIPTAAGLVQLQDLATVERTKVVQQVTTSNGERISTLTLTPAENMLGKVSTDVTERLDSVDLPEGASAEIGGAATEQAESFNQLYLALLAAIAIVYVIMVATFKSLIQPLILLISIPFAATGAIGLLLISGIPLGLPSLIGMLMLVGIVVTNAIVLIDLINQYRADTPERPAMALNEAIMQGARQRLRPILMTALATIFALIPMGLGLTGQSGFISQPLAVVVIGGLISSTLLTLILVPVLYRLVESRKEKRELRRAGRKHSTEQHTGAQDLALAMNGATAKITPGAKQVPVQAKDKKQAKPEPKVADAKPADPVNPKAIPGQVVNPLTGQIPVSRKERRAFEELMNKAAQEPKD
ncbi:hydrogenase expression protein [Arthrobacter sp. MYb229]|uniref:efflux RND transporter permease subunit n=1 Tax=unclassified Arthrobacter TaxID=235627 RepID=UPI000CFCC16D|nr:MULTISPECIES: efflux RND transporter permease subunit [unclassified Arthrobacter]PQZ99172.1 hydrogenase expression protein [Arthrobacter sp. MYb229]PRB47557.1 hydrogenase expression protein [Arthrobacter sp. MYb216]